MSFGSAIHEVLRFRIPWISYGLKTRKILGFEMITLEFWEINNGGSPRAEEHDKKHSKESWVRALEEWDRVGLAKRCNGLEI